MEQGNLIRSKNYLNLDDSINDDQNHELNLSAFSNNQQEDKQNNDDDDDELAEELPRRRRYANVFDTHTSSLDYGDILEEESNVDDGSQKMTSSSDEKGCQTPPVEGNAIPEFDNKDAYPEEDSDCKEDVLDENERQGHQLDLLKELLAVERRQNEQRRHNNSAMQQYLQKMQTEYLRLQRDLVEALELAHKIKSQKEAQLESLGETVKEKDRAIEKLKANLGGLDETKLREEFNALLAKQAQLARMEKQQMKEQVDKVEQQLIRERVANSQAIQQFQKKFDDERKFHENKVELAHKKLINLKLELNQVLNEPQNLVIRELKEEKSKLSNQVEELNLLLDENHAKYEQMRKRIENLLREQEQLERRSRDEIDKLHGQQVEQMRVLNETRLELEDKQEVAQFLQFNLQRSEKRVRNLLGALKSKETTFKETIGQLEVKHEQEIEKAANSLKATERKLIECESQLDKKQNELVKLQLEQESWLESTRSNRDQRVNKLMNDCQKATRELQTVEIKLALQLEEKEQKCKLIEQLQKEVGQFREESKRLSIGLTKCEAKLFSKQQELNQVIKEKSELEEEQQKGQVRLGNHDSCYELEELRRHSKRLEATVDELKIINEKLAIKLKLSESNMNKLNASINKEHAKMVHDYERKLEQIRVEQGNYDRSKLRYKRYGYKLKKYCDHLRRVHAHLCNPSVCGYIIGSGGNTNHQSTPLKSTNNDYHEDKDSLLRAEQTSNSFSSADEDAAREAEGGQTDQQEPIYTDLIDLGGQEIYESPPSLAQQRRQQQQRKQQDKFTIKKTGRQQAAGAAAAGAAATVFEQNASLLSSAASKSARKPLQRSILKSTNSVVSLNSNNSHAISTPTHDHNYYYINEDFSFVNVSGTGPLANDSSRSAFI